MVGDAAAYAVHMIARRNMELEERKTGATRKGQFTRDIDDYLERLAALCCAAPKVLQDPMMDQLTYRQLRHLKRMCRVRGTDGEVSYSQLYMMHPEWFELHHTPRTDMLRQERRRREMEVRNGEAE